MNTFLQYRLHVPVLIFTICLLVFLPEISFDIVLVSLSFSFLGAFIYLFNKSTDSVEDHINLAAAPAAPKHYKAIKITALACFFAPVLILVQWPQLLFLYLALGIVGYMYSAPLKFLGFHRRLKDIFILKNVISAVCWSSVPALVPAFYMNHSIGLEELLIAVNFFVFLMAVEVVWDIRDIEGDQKAGIKTLPNVLGVWPSKFIIGVPILVMFVWRYFTVSIHPIYLAAYLLTFLAILLPKPDSHPYLFHLLALIWIVANSLFLAISY